MTIRNRKSTVHRLRSAPWVPLSAALLLCASAGHALGQQSTTSAPPASATQDRPAAQRDPAARPAGTPKQTASVEGITEYRLDNGLKVLLFPDRTKSTVTVNITYLVGSRHEGRGEAGMAHLLEHMVFKGTDTFENIWGALQDHGANFNGTTWVDRTNYYETLPASEENLDFALKMEADRMVNSRIAGEDLATEMTVVRNEFEMGENSPIRVLMERITSAAFLWHNYGKSTIGNRSDIERVPVENLRKFYERYYQPDNAVLVVAGNFDPEQTLTKITGYFGGIAKPQRMLDATYTEEPTQDGPREVAVQRVGTTPAVGAAYHVPAGTHEDYPALQVLGQILTDSPGGRLYKALVEGDKAASVFEMVFGFREPGLAMFMSVLNESQDVDAAYDTLLATLETLGDAPVTEEEVDRAKASLLKNIKLSLTNSQSIAIELSEWEAQGDWRLFFIHRDRLKEVTREDVQRVAEKYFIESNRTAGRFLPLEEEPMRAEVPATPDIRALVESYTGSEEIELGEEFAATPENIDERTTRTTTDAGIKVALLPKETRGDIVQLRFAFHYGAEDELAPHVTPLSMMPGMMRRGTAAYSYQELNDKLDAIETRMAITGGPGSLSASITTDREHVAEAVDLLAEIVKHPTFPEGELDVVQKQDIAGLEQAKTDPQGLGFNTLTRALFPYPEGSLFYQPTIEEQIQRTQSVTSSELRNLHARFMGANNLEVAAVGDFNPEALTAMLDEHFGEWDAAAKYERVAQELISVKADGGVINTPDKQMAVVIRGTTFPMRDDAPDFAALDFANYVLGQSPKSRLLTALRHKGGLSYGAGSGVQVDDENEVSAMFGFAICAPQNALKAQSMMQQEFANWLELGVTQEELDEFKSGYLLSFKSRLANDDFVAGELRRGLHLDRTFDYQKKLMDAVESLTVDQVNDAIRARLGEATFVDYVAGDQSKFETANSGSEGGAASNQG